MEHILYWLWLTGLYGTASGKLLPLIEHFGSIERIRNANVKELMEVKGINENLAKKILDNI